MSKKTTTLIIRILLFGGTAVSLYFVPWIILKAWILPLPNTVQEQLEEALDYGFEGVIVYVDEGGKKSEFYAAGWHDRDKKNPAYPEALFKIASVNKLFVAVSITKLASEGRISLDGTLDEYFPEFGGRIDNSDIITIRSMVQHRSGIPNFTDEPGFWADPPDTKEGVLELVFDKPANFEPGADYEYSNTNYFLLYELIEKASGISQYEYMKRVIFDPLGLKNTYVSLDQIDMNELMSGYYEGIPEDMKYENYGSMISSAEDLGIFLRALNDGSVFGPGERDIYASIYEFNHTGLIPGYQTIAEYHEDMDTVVIQFTNTTDFNGYNWNLSEVIYNRIIKILRKQRSS